MDRPLQRRLDQLHKVLQYTNPDDGVRPFHFTVYERMMINQERSGIYRFIQALDDDKVINRYEVPHKIENKIQEILTLISER